MKSKQHRLDYHRFGEALIERGLLEREVISHVLQQCEATGALLTEILVAERQITDWELSRVCCELYGLPFLTVDTYPPAANILDGLDPDFLRHYALVPLDRFEGLLTVLMPGIVPTEVLDALVQGSQQRVLPVVGSVQSNREWLDRHLPPPALPGRAAAPRGAGAGRAAPLELEPTGWAGIFDAGDEAVRLNLRRPGSR